MMGLRQCAHPERVLAGSLANAMSYLCRYLGAAADDANYRVWSSAPQDNITLMQQAHGNSNDTWKSELLSPEQMARSTVVPILMYIEGNGYGLSEIADILALVVICIYCFFALSHFFFMLSSGRCSKSWDSIGEISALLLNSERPQDFEHTSAGIEQIATFRRLVSVRATEDEQRVEIVFENAAGRGKYRKIVPNRAY